MGQETSLRAQFFQEALDILSHAEEINAHTHVLEWEYDQVRTGKRSLDENLLQLTFEVIDTLSALAQEGDSQNYIEQMQTTAQELKNIGASSMRRSNFFSRLIEIKRGLDFPLVFISPHSHYYRKAADLISQALGSYTRIAESLEGAVRMHILSEE